MGIRSFFHKIKIGFSRLWGKAIPEVSEIKKIGNEGEERVIKELAIALPSSQIKSNIDIDTPYGKAEIDCMVLYRNKLFAIEIKRWKGCLTETDDGFIQEKFDGWTGEIHEKDLESPFKQLKRAIYLLKKEIPRNVWINPVVYFDNEDSNEISTYSENTWFDDMDDLVNYIKNDGKTAYGKNEAQIFFNECVSFDYVQAKNGWDSLHCIISPESLNFQTEQGPITKKDISLIEIDHYFTYDELDIILNDGSHRDAVIENGKIMVWNNGDYENYSLCKLGYIKIGD